MNSRGLCVTIISISRQTFHDRFLSSLLSYSPTVHNAHSLTFGHIPCEDMPMVVQEFWFTILPVCQSLLSHHFSSCWVCIMLPQGYKAWQTSPLYTTPGCPWKAGHKRLLAFEFPIIVNNNTHSLQDFSSGYGGRQWQDGFISFLSLTNQFPLLFSMLFPFPS